MAVSNASPILQLIRRVVHDPRTMSCPDQELLQRFLAERDKAAFEALLRRHGPMVLDVCRGVLANEADAEDAFQATFLVLARKASSIRSAASLACWLHGVAYRAARKAQAEFARRQKHEARVPERRPAEAADDLTWREVRQVLHEELDRLPRRLRAPLVLCYLQGMTQDRAAAELGLPKGTLKGRLERGRARLRVRLVRRGLGPAALVLASAWPAAALSAGLPAALAAPAVGAATGVAAGLVSARALALAEGVLQSMFLSKVKTAAVLLALVGAVCLGTYTFAVHSPAGPQKPEPQAEKPEGPPEQPQWRGRFTLPMQAGPVHALAVAPDGKMLVVASSRFEKGEAVGEVRLYGTVFGTELVRLPGQGPVAFSPDGKTLATGTGAGTVRLWEVGTWRERTALKGLSDVVTCLAFSPDGKTLAAGSGDSSQPGTPGMVRLWDLESGVQRGTQIHPGGGVYAAAFAGDGKTLVSASSGTEMAIKSWDVTTRREGATTRGPGGRFLAIAFSPDGKTVATAIDPHGDASAMDVKVWDLATGKETAALQRHQQFVQAMAFSRDGKVLATGSSLRASDEERVGLVRLWDPGTGKELAALRGHKHEVRCLTFGFDGKTLATGSWDGSVKLWELSGPEGKEKPPRPAEASSEITVIKDQKITFDPKTCGKGTAVIHWRLGSAHIKVRGRCEGHCWFEFTNEVERISTTYLCAAPVDFGPVTVEVGTVREGNTTRPGIITSFALDRARVIRRQGGNGQIEVLVDGTDEMVAYRTVERPRDALPGQGAKLQLRFRVYADERYKQLVEGAKQDQVIEMVPGSGKWKWLDAAIEGMHVGERRQVRVPEKVAEGAREWLPAGKAGAALYLDMQLVAAEGRNLR